MTKRRPGSANSRHSRAGGNAVAAVEQGRGDPGFRQEDGLEGVAGPTPQQDARALDGVVERFRALHPADWEQLRLCPLQHGLETMVRKLRAYR